MRNLFAIFLSVILLSACLQEEAEGVSFRLKNADVVSWEKVDGGFKVTMSDEKAQEFSELTKKSVGKSVDFYIEETLMSSPVIREPLSSKSFLVFGSEKQEEILNMLDRKAGGTDG